MKKPVDMRYAHNDEQRAVLERILQKGRCPFCMPDLKKYHREEIYEYGYWLITRNQWPYRGAKEHWLLILRRHAERIADIPPGAWSDLGVIARDLERSLKLRGGALAMRFGDSSVTGATVLHIHAHLIVPKINEKTKKARVVRFPIG